MFLTLKLYTHLFDTELFDIELIIYLKKGFSLI